LVGPAAGRSTSGYGNRGQWGKASSREWKKGKAIERSGKPGEQINPQDQAGGEGAADASKPAGRTGRRTIPITGKKRAVSFTVRFPPARAGDFVD
jgi:hypothetical protein